MTNSAVQPCDLLHRSCKVLQLDFSGEGKNKTGLSSYDNWCSLLLCSSWVSAPKLSPCINATGRGLGRKLLRQEYCNLLAGQSPPDPFPATSPLPHFPHLVAFVTFLAYLSGLGEQFGQRITHYFSEKGQDGTRKLTSHSALLRGFII